MKVLQPGLRYYVDKINKREPFSWVRYGDGEWSSIFRDRARTGSGSQSLTDIGLSRAMRKSIAKSWKADNYFPAMRESSLKPKVKQWLLNNQPAHIWWHDCTIFYKSSRKGQLYPFIKALRETDYPIVLVGPPRLQKLNIFPVAQFIAIPGRDAWKDHPHILRKCKNVKGKALFLITAGPTAKPLVWELYPHCGKKSFVLDMGSLWDVYVGKASRRYMRGMLRRGTEIQRNLHGTGAS